MAKKKKNKNEFAFLALIATGVVAYTVISSGKKTGTEEGSGISASGSLPRGLANNNPLNIIRSSETWIGKIPHDESTDPKFEQFISAPYGYRAAIKNIRTYVKKFNLYSVRGIVDKWDSGKIGDSENYIAFVAKKMGVSPNYAFPSYGQDLIYNKSALWKLVQAMAEFENGTSDPAKIKYSDYSEGFDLA